MMTARSTAQSRGRGRDADALPDDTGAAPPVVRARGVAKTYHDGSRELAVLRAVDLDVAAGRSVAIVGASGSGKSTLLHLLGGLDRPTAGAIEIEGALTAAMSRPELALLRRRHSGFVFQFHHLLHEFTALENVMLPMMADGAPARDASARARCLLERVGLGERLRHRPAQLSGGEQQRVAIARAMVNRPTLLLADEPTGNLDEATGRSVADLLFDVVAEAGAGWRGEAKAAGGTGDDGGGAERKAGDEASRGGRSAAKGAAAAAARRHALIVVTHSRELAARADERYELHDGRLRPLD